MGIVCIFPSLHLHLFQGRFQRLRFALSSLFVLFLFFVCVFFFFWGGGGGVGGHRLRLLSVFMSVSSSELILRLLFALCRLLFVTICIFFGIDCASSVYPSCVVFFVATVCIYFPFSMSVFYSGLCVAPLPLPPPSSPPPPATPRSLPATVSASRF